MSNIPNTLSQTLILGVADVTASESAVLKNRQLSRDERAYRFLGEAVHRLCDWLSCDFAQLAPHITDFMSVGPPVYSLTKYHDAMHKADALGLSGAHCHNIDQGGASVTSALILSQALVQQNPHACVLIAGADIPRNGFQGKADYAILNQGVMHPEHEQPYGGNLIGFYAMLAKKQMREHGITLAELEAIAGHFHGRVQANPRAANFEKGITPKQMGRYFAEPYSTPMIAVATDHAVATLVCGEAALPALQKFLRPPASPLYVGHGATAHHAAYFSLKGDLESPSRITGPLVMRRNGLRPADVDYAWIYDCFVGMVIEQSANYFGLSQKQCTVDLARGLLRVPASNCGSDSAEHTIPVNLGGGILNYQAAFMLSSGTGLLDICSAHGLAADPLYDSTEHFAQPPKIALLGGNGGIDTVNSLVPLSPEPFAPAIWNDDARSPGQLGGIPPLRLNDPGKQVGDRGHIAYSTTINYNTGGTLKTPYVLALSRLSDGRLTLSNVIVNGERLKSDADLTPDTPVRFVEHEGLVQAVLES